MEKVTKKRSGGAIHMIQKRTRKTVPKLTDVIKKVKESIFCKTCKLKTHIGVHETSVVINPLKRITLRELEALVEICGGLATDVSVSLLTRSMTVHLLHEKSIVHSVPHRLTPRVQIPIASFLPSHKACDNKYVTEFPSNVFNRRRLPDKFTEKIQQMIQSDEHNKIDVARIAILAAYLHNYRSAINTPKTSTVAVRYEKKAARYIVTLTDVRSVTIHELRGIYAFFQPIIRMRLSFTTQSIEVVIPHTMHMFTRLTSPLKKTII